MQIIQSIRDKGAAIVIAVIALSLIGFILMDAKQGSNRLFSSMSSNVGKVNGESIELNEFNKRVKEAEDQQEQRTGQKPGGTQMYQIRDNMWNQVVAEKIFEAESGKLGIGFDDFTSKELGALLLSNDPSNPFLQEKDMVDPTTGKLDLAKAQQALANIKKFKGDQKDLVNAQIINPLKLTATVAKYSGLLNASVYYPSWMQDKETADNKNFSSISFVNVPYSDISDSTIKVTDDEINQYVQKHKDLFKQDEGRVISYVSFSQLPNGDDSLRTKNLVAALVNSFAADTNSTAFVARNTSVIPFEDEFKPKSKISSSVIDTIIKLPVGTVYGPYLDKKNYVLAKVIGTKELPDSVKARHILISLTDPQTRQPIMSDSSGKKLADSLLAAINAGSDFATLAAKYSADGSKTKGGDLGTFGYGAMVSEFNEYTFTKPVGSKAVVRTQFGYHIIEILSQKDFKPAYKVAFVGKEITASDVTINTASLQATKASAEKDAKSLAAYVSKNGLHLTQIPNTIKENDYTVGSLQDARGLVRWAFEAKTGDVSEPFSIGDEFVVAMVDKIMKEGLQDAATARSGAEVIIRNEKKADIIIKKLGSNVTLESTAAAYNKQIQQAGADSSITMAAQIINGIGVEAKVIGASFNKEYQTKVSPPIAGTSGVYVLKVNGIQAKPADTPEKQTELSKARLNALRSQLNGWFEGLKKQANIKDSRSKFF